MVMIASPGDPPLWAFGPSQRPSLRPPARRCLAVPRCSGLDVPAIGDSTMRRNTTRILTTHTGSLPRPAKVVEQLLAGQRSGAALDAAVAEAVADVIARQTAPSTGVGNDAYQ